MTPTDGGADMTMPHRPSLRGPRVLLRPPRPGDTAERLALGRDPECHRMFGGDPRDLHPLTDEEVRRWYDEECACPLGWVIEVAGRCVGAARLYRLDEANRRARYAIGIYDPACWGRGLGTEATRLVLRYAFEELRLHRVDLRVLAFNERAIRCYQKCGFVREGVEREGALVGGAWQTDVLMSILEQEYRAEARDA